MEEENTGGATNITTWEDNLLPFFGREVVWGIFFFFFKSLKGFPVEVQILVE